MKSFCIFNSSTAEWSPVLSIVKRRGSVYLAVTLHLKWNENRVFLKTLFKPEKFDSVCFSFSCERKFLVPYSSCDFPDWVFLKNKSKMTCNCCIIQFLWHGDLKTLFSNSSVVWTLAKFPRILIKQTDTFFCSLCALKAVTTSLRIQLPRPS